jgi:hypothetical protein
MKPGDFVRMLLFATLLALPACGKKAPPGPEPIVINGIKIDGPKLTEAFVGADPALTSQAHEAVRFLRYGLYVNSLEALDKMSRDPKLNEAQKKVVGEVIEQVKQLVAKSGPNR